MKWILIVFSRFSFYHLLEREVNSNNPSPVYKLIRSHIFHIFYIFSYTHVLESILFTYHRFLFVIIRVYLVNRFCTSGSRIKYPSHLINFILFSVYDEIVLDLPFVCIIFLFQSLRTCVRLRISKMYKFYRHESIQ